MLCCDISRDTIKTAAYVADSAWEIICDSGSGEILMVNSSGVYLLLNGNVVFLCDESMGVVPIGISVENFKKTVSRLRLVQGDTLSFNNGILHFGAGSIEIVKKKAKAQEKQDAFPELTLVQKASAELLSLNRERGISMLVAPLVLEVYDEAIIELNPYCRTAYPLLLSLKSGLSNDNEEQILCAIESLLGLGIGLTPSADDVILGMLFAFSKLSDKAPKTVGIFRDAVFELSEARTSRVSAAYLKAVLNGDYFERMERVWAGLCGIVPLDITPLIEIGGSSGTEMLLGVLLAIRICYKMN